MDEEELSDEVLTAKRNKTTPVGKNIADQS
jgi:hypothetical protein